MAALKRKYDYECMFMSVYERFFKITAASKLEAVTKSIQLGLLNNKTFLDCFKKMKAEVTEAKGNSYTVKIEAQFILTTKFKAASIIDAEFKWSKAKNKLPKCYSDYFKSSQLYTSKRTEGKISLSDKLVDNGKTLVLLSL